MQRFYHRADIIKFLQRHKVLVGAVGLFLFLVVYLIPLFPYVPITTKFIWDFATAQDNLRRDQERTNILLLGLDGRKDQPSSNTDTIIFASIDRSHKQNLMLSIPRDLWVADLEAKVNDSYAKGNMAEGNGLDTARSSISTIVGHPVHYVVTISFDSFVKIIDTLGGIDVNVDRSFVDDSYPIAGRENDQCGGDPQTLCRWEILSFNKGLNHFDGTTALKFARSRHSRGEEGTDFARAARQQKIIAAVKQKVFSPEFMLNPKKIRQMLDIVNASIDTDVPQGDYAAFAKLALAARNTPIRSEVFSWDPTSPTGRIPTTGILYHPEVSAKFKNEWVLLPIGNSYEPIHRWVACLLTGQVCTPEDFVKNKNE
jgi:LCP family protein required for cell wall assembly